MLEQTHTSLLTSSQDYEPIRPFLPGRHHLTIFDLSRISISVESGFFSVRRDFAVLSPTLHEQLNL